MSLTSLDIDKNDSSGATSPIASPIGLVGDQIQCLYQFDDPTHEGWNSMNCYFSSVIILSKGNLTLFVSIDSLRNPLIELNSHTGFLLGKSILVVSLSTFSSSICFYFRLVESELYIMLEGTLIFSLSVEFLPSLIFEFEEFL